MLNDSIENRQRVVVAERRDGGIYPDAVAEMDREVYLRPGADVRGGIYGGRIQMEAPVKAHEPVYARREVNIQTGDEGYVELLGGLAAKVAILVEGNLPVGSYGVRVWDSVQAPHIHLRHAIVRGNVYGDTVILDNCVIFGCAFARQSLKVINSVAGSVQGGSVELSGAVSLWLPLAIAESSFVVSGDVRCLTFCSLKEYHGCGAIHIPCQDFQEGKCTRYVGLLQEDVTAGKMVPVEGDQENLQLLTLSHRLLNLAEARGALDRVAGLLKRTAMMHMLTPQAAEDLCRDIRELGAGDVLELLPVTA